MIAACKLKVFSFKHGLKSGLYLSLIHIYNIDVSVTSTSTELWVTGTKGDTTVYKTAPDSWEAVSYTHLGLNYITASFREEIKTWEENHQQSKCRRRACSAAAFSYFRSY